MRVLSLSSIRLTLLTLLLCLALQPDARAEVADRIVAVVNDDIITLSELNEEGAPYFQALIKQVPTEQQQAEMQKLRQEVLSHLVDQRLIEQQAAKLEIQVSEADIDQTIETILTDNHVSREQYKQDLAGKGLTEPQYREQLKRQMLQSRLVSHEIRSKVVITDERINQYYQENYAAGPGPDGAGYHLLQIGFLFGDEYKLKTAAEARQAATEAKKQLDGGKAFTELAKEVSDLPSKEDGGDIGVFQKSELAPFMKDVVLSLKAGEVSDIIETPTGYQILKLVSAPDEGKDEGKAKVAAPPEIKKEIEAKLYKEEGEKLFNKWISELRAKAFIQENL